MGLSNPSLRLLQTLGQSLDREQDLWQPPVPACGDVADALTEVRSDVVDWLTKLNSQFGFSMETLFTAITLFDRFLHRVRAQRKYLRCVAVTCLYLAAKVCEEDEMIPLTWEVARRSECGYSEAELLRMERCILTKLDWNLRLTPTSYDFVHLFYAVVQTKCPQSLTPPSSRHASNILSQLVLACSRFLQLQSFAPSTVALATLSLYLKLTWEHWLPATQALLSLPQLNEGEISECREAISRCLGAQIIDLLHSSHHQQSGRQQQIQPTVETTQQHISYEDSGVETAPSLPVTPHPPPAKRRKVEQDDDVYIDIRRLYTSDDSNQERFVEFKSCASEAQWFDNGPLLAPFAIV